MRSLVPGAGKFVVARGAAAICAGDGGGSVWRTAAYLVHDHLTLKRVWQPDNDHSLVQQGDMEAKDGRLLAPVLGVGAGQNTTCLAD